MSYQDNIFGNLFEPKIRLSLHQADLTGIRHLNRRQPLDVEPNQPVELTVTTAGPHAIDRIICTFQPDGGAAATLEFAAVTVAWDTALGDYVRTWRATLPPQPARTMIRYQIAGQLAGCARWIYADNQADTAAEATSFAYWVAADPIPDWARTAVVYHIFVDRFYPGDGIPWKRPATLAGFYGGTLRGIIQKLDYICQMGFTAIWLSPIFPSPTHHGYDATDYFAIEPRLGTLADFKELVSAAHTRGLRLLLDFAANHCSNQHPAFQAAQSAAASPYRDWFTWLHWPDEYATYFGVRELPEINVKHGPTRAYLLESARFWLELGVDGFRLDYAHGPAPDFWADFRRVCRESNPTCWTFGEINRTPVTQLAYTGTMDGTLDFMLCRALRETFAHRSWSPARFEAFLSAHEAFFPPTFSRPAFFDNHDMNRILFIAQEESARVKLAALALFTLSGPPIIYNGSEVGVTQERPIHQNDFGIFEECRQPMKWGNEQDSDLRESLRRLIQLRHEHPLLLDSPRRLLHLDEQTFAYARQAAHGCVVAAFNLAGQPQRIFLPGLPPMCDALNAYPVTQENGGLVIELPAQSGAFLVEAAQ